MKLLGAAIATAALLFATAAEAQRPFRVAIVHIAGGTEAEDVRAALEAALKRQGKVAVVPTREYKLAARKYRIPSREWLTAEAVSTIGVELDLDAIIVGRMTAVTRWSYVLSLQVRDVQTLKLLSQATAQFSLEIVDGVERPALSDARMDDLARKLLQAVPMQRRRRSAPPIEEMPQPPAGEKPSGDGAGTGSGDGSAGAPEGGGGGFETDWSGGFGDEGDAAGGGSATDGTGTADGFSTGFGDAAESFADDLGFGNLNPTLGGRIGGSAFVYPLDLLNEDDAARAVGRQQVEAAVRVSIGDQRAKGVGSVLARRDFADPSRDRFDVEEAYAEVAAWGLSLRAGRSFVTWGTASIYNPTDIINPRDFRDLVDTEKWATWMVRVGWTFGPASIEGYWLPVVEPYILPFPELITADGRLVGRNRWVKGSVDTEDAEIPLRIRFLDRGAPPPSIGHMQAATRASLALFGMDFSLGYAYMFERFPSLTTTVDVAKPLPLYADVLVATRYTREHLVTADAEWAIGKLRLAGEALVGITEDWDSNDDQLTDPYAIVVGGLDWQTSTFFDTHFLHFFVEGSGALAIGGELRDDAIGRLRYPFPLSLLGRGVYNFGSQGLVALNLISNFDQMLDLASPSLDQLSRYDLLLSPEAELLVVDIVRLRIAALVLLGHEEGLFGRYLDNARIEGGVTVQF